MGKHVLCRACWRATAGYEAGGKIVCATSRETSDVGNVGRRCGCQKRQRHLASARHRVATWLNKPGRLAPLRYALQYSMRGSAAGRGG